MTSSGDLVEDEQVDRVREALVRYSRKSLPSSVRAFPDAVRLDGEFDVARMQGEVRRLSRRPWQRQQIYTGGTAVAAHRLDWRVLPLRGPDGDVERTDAGGIGTQFADTEAMAAAPYLRSILGELGLSLRGVRLTALGPGARSAEHCDPKFSFPWGLLRLHIPIETNDGALLHFDGSRHCWEPGSLYFGNFARPHWIENTGEAPRVHLVIDSYLTQQAVSLFPEDLKARVTPPDGLALRPEAVPDPSAAAAMTCQFDLPPSFLNTAAPNEHFQTTGDRVPVRVMADGDGLRLESAGRSLPLVRTEEGELRFAGWSDERSIRVVRVGGGTTVVLTARCGPAASTLEIRAKSSGP